MRTKKLFIQKFLASLAIFMVTFLVPVQIYDSVKINSLNEGQVAGAYTNNFYEERKLETINYKAIKFENFDANQLGYSLMFLAGLVTIFIAVFILGILFL